MDWLPVYPDYLYRLSGLDPRLAPISGPQPILPIPNRPPFLSVRPHLRLPIDEQESGTVLATLVDQRGRVVPGAYLTDLRLTLAAVRADNTIAIVNGRDGQFVYNANQVQVFNSLQSAAGRTYNFRWSIQPGDTTLVDPTLAFETHRALFTYRWIGGRGYIVVHLIVRNLGLVS